MERIRLHATGASRSDEHIARLDQPDVRHPVLGHG